ncbi:CPBP family intramembrane glutamic endopeptidase [Janthinobacterium fluminis]|uniref:Type II CAAX endopeptidase family protein n=1 Tax=Janthinobacterium fluminis TaxID=2987524 RepID=A0ABT5JXU4_9BURK|nr:type II CAAX endopeptidase family protein [Janthinobacterium fluminis]MDC8756372.1 type II CAAX endopeptidase family protein [Janthinobacterium fluminis]
MKIFFFDEQHQLRNGWKILAFLAVTASLIFPSVLVLKTLPPELRMYAPKIVFLVVGVLTATWLCLRAEGRSLASVGCRLDRRFGRQFGLGLAGGVGALLLVALLVRMSNGYHLVVASHAALPNLLKGAVLMLGIAAMEELAYRGYAFQRAIRGMGVLGAQLLFAVIFCASHPLNGGMSVAMMLLVMLNIFLFAIIAGICYVRTGSLAASIGVHMGWNWAQQSLGFGVGGADVHGWYAPVFHGRPDWLTGGAFGLEASAASTIILVGATVVLACWRGEKAVAPSAARRGARVRAA